MSQEWVAKAISTEKGQKLFQKCDYEQYKKKKVEYENLSKEEKTKYKGADDYIQQHGGFSLTSLFRNYMLLNEEITAQVQSSNVLEVFPIETIDHDIEIQDLLLSLEDENHLKEIYRKKKLQVKKAGINNKDATIIRQCIRQGRTLLQAGLKAEMLAKPLIDFYAASAYAYAVIVMNSPLHKSIDTLKGSHGHTYNHTTKTVDFGGDIPSGTFLDLLCALSVANITQIDGQPISFKYSVLSSIEMVQNNSISISLLALLSMVPELSDHYDKLDSGHKNVHRLSIDTGIVNNKVTYNFYIGDGVNRPNKEILKKRFNTEIINENQGSYKVSVEAGEITKIDPVIYHDLYGHLWYVESPIDGLYLPEVCLHFLIISALCNIMRYSPHEWSDILNNRTSSVFSLVINQYIRIFERKFPLIIAQYLSNYNVILKK